MTTREDLLRLRNDLIQQPLGGVLLEYLSDYITAEACKNINAEQIKGMCVLLQRIKDIPQKVENMKG